MCAVKMTTIVYIWNGNAIKLQHRELGKCDFQLWKTVINDVSEKVGVIRI